ncbi:MAG: FdhF/YdeP family oxidoreductase [Bacteroidota bacterium]
MSRTKRNISITGRITDEDLTIKPPAHYAAGLGGIKAALDHVQKEMGLVSGLRELSQMNQKDGFDCPGCAWPDPDERSNLGEYCENGAKALSEEATTRRVDETFFERHSVEELSEWSDLKIGKSGRITRPFILRAREAKYQPISWEAAFSTIGEHLRKLDSPDEAVFYTSGRSSNEAAFLYGLFARALGTNNMPDCSNMCHESSGVALKETLGIGKGSVTLDDFSAAELILIIGQNPGTNHPRMLSALEQCKQNGGKIIAINPLREAGLLRFKNPQTINGWLGSGTELTDLYLQVRINEDVALLNLIMKRLLARQAAGEQVLDEAFIEHQTAGFDALDEELNNLTASTLLDRCGLTSEAVDAAVDMIAKREKIIVCWAMGLTQHKNAVDNIKACVNLLLLKGSIGKKGAGTCPVRGHSNVQGDRTVGIMHYVSKPLNAAIQKVFAFDPPKHIGYDTVHAIQAMHTGKAKVFMALGGNLVSAASDTAYTAEALQSCDLTVSVSTKLNRTHLVPGRVSIILPTLGRSEADLSNGKPRYVTVENSMGRVHRSQGKFEPASEHLKSEPEIVAGIAEAYFEGKGPVQWKELGQDYALIREKISAVIAGFEHYSSRSAATGFDLPNNARAGDFSQLPGGKAQFSVTALPSHSLGEDEFMLTTIRSHDQFNTTIYGMDDRYRGVFGDRRVVFMNPQDMVRYQLSAQDPVDLLSHYDGQTRRAEQFKVVPYDIPTRNLAAYFPETNVLVPITEFADKSQTPISKSIKVTIERRERY